MPSACAFFDDPQESSSATLLCMQVTDLGTMPYRQAWALQERIHQQVLEGADEHLLLVEHPPVITFGRRPEVARNLVASDEQLAELGVEVVQSDRGGDITFHGPGQLVAYPIVRLNDHKLSVGAFVRTLEQTVIAALEDLGIPAMKDHCAVGVWVGSPGSEQLSKICALGVRIRRGVSMHGIALNVTTDLRYFDLIVPCGLAGRRVTSVSEELGPALPSMERVKQALTRRFVEAFGSHTKTLATPTAAAPQ
jgi:lipoyl(octanoyl) transferase